MNIPPLLDALGIQEDAARALTDDLRTQIAELPTRLWEAETHLEHLAITRKTVTALADRIPAQSGLPENLDYPRILGVFNEVDASTFTRKQCSTSTATSSPAPPHPDGHQLTNRPLSERVRGSH